MKLQEHFQKYIHQRNLFPKDAHLLLAVSGGIDSVVLTHLCHQAGYKFSIAHCNFQLRGEDSNRDEQFVKELAAKYHVPFFAKTFNTKLIAQQQKTSIEETARNLRYTWFNELLTANNSELSAIVTAHHADDNIETMLMNFFRGTGIKGLRGIQPKNGKIVRPLLFAKKTELEDYSKEQGLRYVTDATNFETEYTRNFFRHKIIPLVKEIYPETEQNLLNNLQRFTEVEELYQHSIDQHKKKLLESKGNEVHIPVLKLKKVEPLYSIVYEIVKDYGFTAAQTNDVIALLDAENSKYVQSATHRIIRNRAWLIIAPLQTTVAETILIEEGVNSINYSEGDLVLQQLLNINYQLSISPVIAAVDASKVQFPLLLRKWKAGDYFYPLGMKKKKKIARFLIDQKLSKTQKENIWVLESNQKIIWIVGQRIDDRFKVTSSTKNILQISYTPSDLSI